MDNVPSCCLDHAIGCASLLSDTKCDCGASDNFGAHESTAFDDDDAPPPVDRCNGSGKVRESTLDATLEREAERAAERG